MVLRNLFPKQEDENKNFKVIEHEKEELCNTFNQIDESYQTVDCKRIGIIKKENEVHSYVFTVHASAVNSPRAWIVFVEFLFKISPENIRN